MGAPRHGPPEMSIPEKDKREKIMKLIPSHDTRDTTHHTTHNSHHTMLSTQHTTRDTQHTTHNTEREVRVRPIRKTTNGHHQLALAQTHHGVRKKKKCKKENIQRKIFKKKGNPESYRLRMV